MTTCTASQQPEGTDPLPTVMCLTVAAERLNVSPPFMYNLFETGRLRLSDLEQFIEHALQNEVFC